MPSGTVVALGRSSNDLLPAKEVAKIRNCSEAKLEWERANGRGPAYVRDGRKILYRRRDLDAYIAANLHGGAAADPKPRRRGRLKRAAEQPAT
jgi:hypothetical protein